MANAVNLGHGAPIRLKGVLAVGAVIGAGTNKKERIDVEGLAGFKIRAELSAITSTPDLECFPMLANAVRNDTVGTRATTDVPSLVAFASADTEIEMDVTVDGEKFFEVQVTAGGSEAATIKHIDIFPKRI